MNKQSLSDNNTGDLFVVDGVKISFEDIMNEMRDRTGATPLGESDLYFDMDVNVDREKSMGFGAIFRVKARSREQARQRALIFLRSERELDDTGFEIGWTSYRLYNPREDDQPEVEIIGKPYDEATFLEQRRIAWIDWAKEHGYRLHNQNSAIDAESRLSEWIWPIIFIPLIILVIVTLEYISNQ